jgi:hypothetical protein
MMYKQQRQPFFRCKMLGVKANGWTVKSKGLGASLLGGVYQPSRSISSVCIYLPQGICEYHITRRAGQPPLSA